MDLTAHEQRVLGCLIEKQRTTPDVYPLSTNALRAACNQTTNRDPVLALDDEQVRAACQGLAHKRLARLASRAGVRTIKYRHLADEALNLSTAELALLTVLLLRGPQTVGELRTRSERLHSFPSLGQVSLTLEALESRGLVELLAREPGRKEPRYAHTLGPRPTATEVATTAGPAATAPAAAHPSSATPSPSPSPAAQPAAAPDQAMLARIEALERRIAVLEAELGLG